MEHDKKSLIESPNWLNRTACAAAAALAFTLAACDDASVSHVSPDECDSGLALAEQIVTGLAQSYADRHHDGKERAFAVDLSLFDNTSLLGDRPQAHAPELEDGLRRFAQTLSDERASWVFRFYPIEAHPDISGGADLYADVIDLHADYCCFAELVALARDEEGWRVAGFHYGGHMEESSDFRQERLARGAEVRPH